MLIDLLGILTISFVFAVICNAAADRLPINQSVIYPGPYCRWCATKLSWKDSIPILSYLNSKGKCPYCGEKIPLRNLTVDISVFAWVSLYIAKFGWEYTAMFEMLFGIGLITIIIIVQENRVISNILLLLLGAIGVIYWLGYYTAEFPAAVISSAIGAAVIFNYNITKVVSKTRAHIDWSEVKYGATLGLFLGFSQVILCIFIAIFLGAAIGSFRIKYQRIYRLIVFPEFPALMSFSGMIVILFGQDMLNLYLEFAT